MRRSLTGNGMRPSLHGPDSIRAVAVALVVALSLLGAVSYAAATPANQDPGSGIAAAAVAALVAKASCQAGLGQSYISNISSSIPSLSGSLGAYSASLSQLNSGMGGYSGSGNLNGALLFVSSQLNPELAGAGSGIASLFESYAATSAASASPPNLTAARDSLIMEYAGLLGAYSGCSFSPDKSLAGAKLDLYLSGMAQAENYSESLASQGINVSSLDAIMAGANSSIIGPLGSAINGATLDSQLEDSIGAYCLYDGCTYSANIHKGTIIAVNYHLAAKMQAQGAQLILDRIRSTDPSANAADLISAQSHISNASQILQGVGTSPYGGQQGAEIAQNLSEAASLIRASVGTAGSGTG